MKTLALIATFVNAIIVVFIFQNMHATELRTERRQHAAEMNALQAELDHTRQMAAAMAQMLSQQEQGQQLEKWGAQ